MWLFLVFQQRKSGGSEGGGGSDGKFEGEDSRFDQI